MKTKKYSLEIADVIRTFLDEDDWNYTFDEETGIFRFGLRMSKCKIKTVQYRISVREDMYVLYIILPIGADHEDAEQMARMSEYLHRVNYGLLIGNFEIDYRDGEIRYKVCTDCEGQIPCSTVICNSIHVSGSTVKKYADGIVDIFYSDVSPEEAEKKYESDFMKHMVQQLEERRTASEGGEEDAMLQLLEELFDEGEEETAESRAEAVDLRALFEEDDDTDEEDA